MTLITAVKSWLGRRREARERAAVDATFQILIATVEADILNRYWDEVDEHWRTLPTRGEES